MLGYQYGPLHAFYGVGSLDEPKIYDTFCALSYDVADFGHFVLGVRIAGVARQALVSCGLYAIPRLA